MSLQKIHEMQTRLWQKLEEACVNLNLRYYAVHGTLLGAVRNQGFIPWDDDMDFAMPRKDFDVLSAHAAEQFQPPFFFQTEDSDRGCYFGGYARLMDESTTCMSFPEILHPCRQGIRIDIFPLDFCGDAFHREKKQRAISRAQQILFAKYYPAGVGVLKGLSVKESAGLAVQTAAIPGVLLRKQLKDLYRGRESDTLTISVCLYGKNRNRNVYQKQWFDEAVRVPFEGGTIPIPCGYREILLDRYGPQYMEIPEEKPSSAHLFFTDPFKSYRVQDRGKILQQMEMLSELNAAKGAIMTSPPAGNAKERDSSVRQQEVSVNVGPKPNEPSDPSTVPGEQYGVGLLMGVFDMFHVGHLKLIRRAKEHCAYLRVAVLSDELTEKFKGSRPVIPLEERIEVLSGIKGVDEVVSITDTPSRLTEWNRRPFDCFFSGDDYKGNEYWEWEKKELNKLGADIVFFPYSKEQSSSKIREKMKTGI